MKFPAILLAGILIASLVGLSNFDNAFASSVYISVKTDQGSYREGEIITIYGKINNPKPYESVLVIVNDPSGKIVHERQVSLNDKNKFMINIDTSNKLFSNRGSYSITVHHSDTVEKVYFSFSISPEISQAKNSESQPEVIKLSTKSSIPTQSTPTVVKTPDDDLYRDSAYKVKQTYYEALTLLESGIKLSESSLSDIVLEDTEAKKQIEAAVKYRVIASNSIALAKSSLYNVESYLEDHEYQKAWNKIQEIDNYISSAKNNISGITKEIRDAKKLEDDYQEKIKFCFLFWCYVKAQNEDLDLNIKDIELTIEKIYTKEQKTYSEQQRLVQKLQLAKQERDSIAELEKQERDSIAELEKQERDSIAELAYQERIKQQELAIKQQEIENKERQRQEETKYLIEQQNLQAEKHEVIKQAQYWAIINGLIKGELTYYFSPLPTYASSDVRSQIERMATSMDGLEIKGVKLIRVYDGSPDFTINWARDYQEEVIGRMIGDHLLIGLGKTGCDDVWKPFDGNTVYKITLHELGHAMGYSHSKDPGNIMYYKIETDFSIDYDLTINLKDGYSKIIPFCDGKGKYYYELKSDSKYTGFNVYAAPITTTPQDIVDGTGRVYADCFGKGYTSFSATCEVGSGAYLLIQNPSDTFVTSMNIHVKIIDLTDPSPQRMIWDESSQFFSSEYYDYIRELFH